MKHTFVEENIKSLIMTYKVKSLAYLVVFVAIAFTYHITDNKDEATFADNINHTEMDQEVSTISIEKRIR